MTAAVATASMSEIMPCGDLRLAKPNQAVLAISVGLGSALSNALFMRSSRLLTLRRQRRMEGRLQPFP